MPLRQDAANSSSHLSWKAPGRIAGMSGAVVNPFDFHQKRESFVEDVELVGTGDDEDDSFLDSAGPAAQGRPAGGAAQPSLVDSVLGNAELQRLGRLCGRYKKKVASVLCLSVLCLLLGLYMLVFVLQGAAAAAGRRQEQGRRCRSSSTCCSGACSGCCVSAGLFSGLSFNLQYKLVS